MADTPPSNRAMNHPELVTAGYVDTWADVTDPDTLIAGLRSVVAGYLEDKSAGITRGDVDTACREVIALLDRQEATELAGGTIEPGPLPAEVVTKDGHRVRIEVDTDGEGREFVSVVGVNCDLAGEEPGMYYPKPSPAHDADAIETWDDADLWVAEQGLMPYDAASALACVLAEALRNRADIDPQTYAAVFGNPDYVTDEALSGDLKLNAGERAVVAAVGGADAGPAARVWDRLTIAQKRSVNEWADQQEATVEATAHGMVEGRTVMVTLTVDDVARAELLDEDDNAMRVRYFKPDGSELPQVARYGKGGE